MQNPMKVHWKIVKRILQYLSDTLDFGTHLKKSNNLNVIGLCDVDWASNSDDRRSTLAYCVYLGPNLIS